MGYNGYGPHMQVLIVGSIVISDEIKESWKIVSKTPIDILYIIGYIRRHQPKEQKMEKHHPEQQDDEIYMGNGNFGPTPMGPSIFDDEPIQSSWLTLRVGEVALDNSGRPIKDCPELKPFFIQATEVQRKIDHIKQAAEPNDFEVTCLQEMLDSRTLLSYDQQ